MGISSRDATGEQLQVASDDAAESDPIHSFHKSALIRRREICVGTHVGLLNVGQRQGKV